MVAIIDKSGALHRLDGAKIELGCGPRKRSAEYIGVDLLDYEGVDLIGDVFDVLAQIPDSTLSEVFSAHFVEHVADLDCLISELTRVIRPKGVLKTVAPHFSNPYFWSDSTHKRPFGLYSMAYYASGAPFKRAVPTYQRFPGFRLDDVTLVFKSPPPFYVRYGLKRIVHHIVNSTTWSQEFYEENLAFVLPCYEVQYTMTRLEVSA